MNMKKLMAGILSLSMLATAATAFAAAPSAYDGQPYPSNVQSNDSDGEMNLAVIANGKVDIVGDASYIKGSVYSNDTIYVGDGAGNKVDGLFISGVKGMTDYTTGGDLPDQFRAGYIHVNDNHEEDVTNAYSTTLDYEGAIYDEDTSFECSYEPFEVPEIANNIGEITANTYEAAVIQISWWPEAEFGLNPKAPRTITEDTYIEKLMMNGSQIENDTPAALTVDTTNGDVTVVINQFTDLNGQSIPVNPTIRVIGENEAYIYINNVGTIKDFALNYNLVDKARSYDPVVDGSVEHTHLYLSGDDVSLELNKIAVADITVNANSLQVIGSSTIAADINSGAESFLINGGQTSITGVVCVPNADSKVVDNGTIYGQLHTDTLTINGAASIIWREDSAEAIGDPKPADPTEAPAEPTPTPDVPKGDEIDLYGLGYAYIFGYEPGAPVDGVTSIYMAPDDDVTREQVASMLMRMIDQKNGARNASYQLTPNIAAHKGTWYVRGLAYLASKGTFVGIDSVEVGPVSRGEVAKLVAYGLNLSNTTETAFADIADSPYKQYIEIMAAYGYMEGTSDNGFEPNRVMTRAEFCKMFNNIIGRDAMGLTMADGRQVTAEDYSIVDIDGHWAESTILKATSAYDSDGNVDLAARQDNIRNKLDNYDSQLDY